MCRHLTAKEDYAKFYDLDSSEEEDDEKEKLKAKPSKKKEVAKKNRDSTREEDSDSVSVPGQCNVGFCLVLSCPRVVLLHIILNAF